jgi:predicted Zn-dependent protease
MTIAIVLALAFAGPALSVGNDEPADAKKGEVKDAPAKADEPAKAEDGKEKPPAAPDDKAKAPEKKSQWRDGYRLAVSFIQAGRYDDGLSTLASLDKADSPDVFNYLGYASRKLGRLEDARQYYEAALALDPDHRGVLEYFGEWHVEMGKLAEARAYLNHIALRCGTTCREYLDLAEAIAVGTPH